MRILNSDPQRLILEGRRLPQTAWFVWGLLFLPGLVGLWFLPESSRLIGLLVWIVIWLGLFALLPRWLGEVIRVTVDSKAREITWANNKTVTRTIPFNEINRLDVKLIRTASRPYKAFQLVALLKNATQITLAVSPNEAEAQRALELARSYFRKR
jgi:hypothetical protein